MKVIYQSRLKEILDYDPLTGIFTWKEKIADKVVVSKRAGYRKPNGYRFIRINKKSYREHHLAFLYMKGYLPKIIDHINHNPSDNSWNNLREVTTKENGKNHPKTKRNLSGFVGVSQRPDEQAKNARQQANKLYGFHPNHGV